MKISHVNHSSILCETENDLLLTDPWLVSNAFQGWSQFPSPNINEVKKIISKDNNLSFVLLSHAHDDHVDDIFLSKLKDNVKVIIPKTNNLGLKKRVSNTGIKEENIIIIDNNKVKVGDFYISAISNGTLSDEDFIFLISNKNNLVIHANDNWHLYNYQTIEYIKSFIKNNSLSNIILLSQIGIADSFPLFYERIKPKDKKKIIENKIKKMCTAFKNNCIELGIDEGYAYANQSRFSKLNNLKEINFNPYKIKDEIIQSFEFKIIQLMPSDKIINGKFIKNHSPQESLLEHRLNNLENQFKNYSIKKNLQILPVKFKSMAENRQTANEIILYAEDNIWNEILSGLINLETIITGGNGYINKPLNYNMKNEYLLLSKWAYINQNQAKNDLNINL